jgi:hypothetical protein
MTKTTAEPIGTQFLNVDLDIISKVPLDAIVDALGSRVFVLYVGRWGRRHSAHFELAGYSQKPQADRLVRRFVKCIEDLPRSARRLWDTADVREFNIGIEAAKRSPVFELRLRPDTLADVARVKGQVVVTVYAPHRVVGSVVDKPKNKKGRLTSA